MHNHERVGDLAARHDVIRRTLHLALDAIRALLGELHKDREGDEDPERIAGDRVRRPAGSDLIDAMPESRITVMRNKKAGSGDYKLIGLGRGGLPITIVVARTALPGRWCPITGRRSNNAERRSYEH